MLAATRLGIFSVAGNVIIGQPDHNKSQEVVCPFVIELSKAKSAK